MTIDEYILIELGGLETAIYGDPLTEGWDLELEVFEVSNFD